MEQKKINTESKEHLKNEKKQNRLKYTLSIMPPLQLNRLQDKLDELDTLAKEFAAHKVSAAGISYIVNSRSSVRRILWLFGVFLCMGIMGYMSINVLLEYLGYPKMLVKQDVILPRLEFPAVTICSLDPISEYSEKKNTTLDRFLALKRLLQNSTTIEPKPTVRKECFAKPLCRWSWFREECTCEDNPCLTEFCLATNETHCVCSNSFCTSKNKVQSCQRVKTTSNSLTKNQCICKGISTQEDEEPVFNSTEPDIDAVLSEIENSALREVVRLIKTSQTYDLLDVEEGLIPPTKELYEYGSTFDELVASCSYEGINCHRENFTILYHPNYGKCFMFNYVGTGSPDVEKPIRIHSYGSNSGLQLVLRVTDRSALDLLRREIGARIVIHNPQSLPFVSEYGVNVKPRDMTAVEMSVSTMERLGKPFGDCQNDSIRMYNGDLYSILGCEKLCNYKHMTKRCNCTLRHLLRGSVLIEKKPPHRLCDISNQTERECAIDALEDIEQRSECNCKPPCNETIYSYSVTSSVLNVNYFKTIKAVRTLIRKDGKLKYYNYSDEKSMVGVKVYFNTFQVSMHKEIAYYSWETLVANIGGNLGFFMGLTLVTFLEIAEFLWDFIRTAFNCKTSKSKVHSFQSGKESTCIRCHKRRKLKDTYRRQTV